jgi:hypothetical protein
MGIRFGGEKGSWGGWSIVAAVIWRVIPLGRARSVQSIKRRAYCDANQCIIDGKLDMMECLDDINQ